MKNITKGKVVGTALTTALAFGTLGALGTTAHADQLKDAEVNLPKTEIVAPQHAQVAPVKEMKEVKEEAKVKEVKETTKEVKTEQPQKVEENNVVENKKQEVKQEVKAIAPQKNVVAPQPKVAQAPQQHTVKDVKFVDRFYRVQGQEPKRQPIEKFVVSGLGNGVTAKVLYSFEANDVEYVKIEVKDGFGNTITHDIPVSVNTMPVITLDKHRVLVEQGQGVDVLKSLGAKSYDLETGTLNIQVTGNTNTSELGERSLQLKATDNTNLSVTEDVIMNVVRFKKVLQIEKNENINYLDASRFVEGLSNTARAMITNVDEARDMVTVKVTDGENSIFGKVKVTKEHVNEEPSISVENDYIFAKQGEVKDIITSAKVTASDREDGDLSKAIKVSGFDPQASGVQTVTLTVTDSNGATVERKVYVRMINFVDSIKIEKGFRVENIANEKLVTGLKGSDGVYIKDNGNGTITVSVRDNALNTTIQSVVKVEVEGNKEDKGTNEDRGNKDDNDTVTEDKGNKDDNDTVTEDKGNKDDNDTVTEDKGNKDDNDTVTEDKGNKDDNGTVTEDKGNKDDNGTVTEDKGNKDDNGTVTEDKGNKDDNGTVTEDKGNKDDNGTVTEDKGNKDDNGTVTEDKGNKDDNGTVTEDKGNKDDNGTQTNDGAVTNEKDSKGNKETVSDIKKEGDEKVDGKVAEKQVDKKDIVKKEVAKPSDKTVEKEQKTTKESKEKELPKTGGDQSTTMGSLIAGGLALLAGMIFRRKGKQN
ncbi:LPXTG cell wall anchor domain-containing protein [Bacillus sp. BRTN]|uniref:LPXTG cell wall anchor domain-containing protein n=1 Tax=Bacillus sp. BRTN TaxID=2875730 RepID=UPI001D0C9E76|nr:LPXTG cell wall anchor domain-containing protein [Bacillus sp. BRTN]MCC0758705.1 LPXTG cell wall anchor domain-containing protein [Bacillus sp. BRTN]